MLDLVKKNPLIVAVAVILLLVLYKGNLKEGWGTSPATLIQLASSSGYYPYWRYGFGYKYPNYRFRYPYHSYYPMGYYPIPYGNYKYGMY